MGQAWPVKQNVRNDKDASNLTFKLQVFLIARSRYIILFGV